MLCNPGRFSNCTSIRWNSQLRSGFHRMCVRPGMAVVYVCSAPFCPSTPTGCAFRSATPCSWSPIDEVIKGLMHDCVINKINRAADAKRDYRPHLEEQKICLCLAGFCASTMGKCLISNSKIKWLLIEYFLKRFQLNYICCVLRFNKRLFSNRWKIVFTNRDFSVT